MDSYLNSIDFIEVTTEMQSEEHESRIQVYVESENDISFWKTIFNQAQENKFIVKVYDHQGTNCRTQLVKMLEKGELNRVCYIAIDADIDILFHDALNRLHLENKYVIHTYCYSRENVQFSVENIRNYFCEIIDSFYPDFDMSYLDAIWLNYLDSCYKSIRLLVNQYLHVANKLLPEGTNIHFGNTITVQCERGVFICSCEDIVDNEHPELDAYLNIIDDLNSHPNKYIQGHKLDAHMSLFEQSIKAEIKKGVDQKKIQQFDNFIKNNLGSLKVWVFNQKNSQDSTVIKIIKKIELSLCE